MPCFSLAALTALELSPPQPVGWVEPFAKPIAVVHNMMGIASLHPSYEDVNLFIPDVGRI